MMNETAQAMMIDEFLQNFRKGVESWVKAGEVLLKLVDDDPHVYDAILKKEPLLNARILSRMEDMGRRTLHPMLALGGSAGCRALAKLPMSQQERYLKESVPLVVHTPKGDTDVLLVKVQDLTPEQVKQVFDRDRIRTQGEQKAQLMQDVMHKTSKTSKQPKIVEMPWKIVGGKVEFLQGVRLTAAELATILAQLTK